MQVVRNLDLFLLRTTEEELAIVVFESELCGIFPALELLCAGVHLQDLDNQLPQGDLLPARLKARVHHLL